MPWGLFALCGLWVAAGLRAPAPGKGFHLAEFARLPTVCNGRLQPLDSAARNSLLILRHKRSLSWTEQTPEGPRRRRMDAPAWLAETLFRPDLADRRPAFRIDHPELRDLLGLTNQSAGFDVSFRRIEPALDKIDAQAQKASQLEPALRDSFQRAVLRLHYALVLYQRLKNSIQPETATNFLAEIEEFLRLGKQAVAIAHGQDEAKPENRKILDRLLTFMRRYQTLDRTACLLPVPPADASRGAEQWTTVGQALLNSIGAEEPHPAVRAFAAMALAYRQGDAARFNSALGDYARFLRAERPRAVRQARLEAVYNRWQPFYRALALYLLGFLAACLSWLGRFRTFNRAAGALVLVAFLAHTGGILMRMAIEHRPPVTNLYSSAVFVGWGAAGLGLLLERRYRQSLALAMAAVVGFLTQLIAHQLALGGDTMEPLRAVLDTNFWLATHVVTITLGYSATYVAGFLALLYILRTALPHKLAEETETSFAGMVYGAICFAVFFSFLGTVLGGIWADQSWGRFWGWDPKENGALLVVLWNALIIHAYRQKLVGARGLMNLAVAGNAITSFSWFGVNMLGVGLHSYGFMDRAFTGLVIFILSQAAVLALSWLTSRRRVAPQKPLPA